MCFLGNPGTGKTTIMGILTGLLYKYQYIKKNQYIYTDASSILSSTNPSRRMELLLQKSHNKVIFIDEAYMLAYDNSGYKVLTLLLNAMENNRNDTIIVLAGYKKEMKTLLALNSGLPSRINKYLFFSDYTQTELIEILHKMSEDKGFTISKEAEEKLTNILLWKMCQSSFANARTVRQLLESAILRHYYNLEFNHTSLSNAKIILPEDIELNEEEDIYLQNL